MITPAIAPAAPVIELCKNVDNPVAQHLGLNAREHAAIALRVPDSGNEWLDKMIRTAQRNDLAARAIQADLSDSGLPLRPADMAKLIHHAYDFADAMLSGAATPTGE